MEKTERFNKYLNNIINVHVILSVENIRHIAEIIILSGDSKFLSKQQTADMYASVDKAANKVEHQLREHRERIKGHSRKHKESPSQTKRQEDAHKPAIIKNSYFFDKPVSCEEATMELELQDYGFFVFRDVEDDKIKVIYKRKDKNYGLIEPE